MENIRNKLWEFPYWFVVSDRRQAGTKAQVSYLTIILLHEQQHLALYLTLTVNNNITNQLYYTIIYTYDMPDLKLVLANNI